MTTRRPSLPARGGIMLIRCYQRFLSPLTGAKCIYRPTCSQYMLQAIERFGLWRGLWLGIKRIARCHPWASGGYDPVPEAPSPPADDATVNG